MTGISEILVLVLLITCILILPRLFKAEPRKKPSSSISMRKIGARTRLAIILTFVYPLAAALYMKPWTGRIVSYLSYGILPVILAWGVIWVLAGRKQ